LVAGPVSVHGAAHNSGDKSREVRALHRAGIGKAEIARRLQIGRTPVRCILTSKRV
jgi:hypothetical protein